MKTVAIIQARTGSTRLPGKVLQDLVGRTVLARVIDRLKRFQMIDDLFFETSTDPSDDGFVD